jgi:hypothetical protein
MLIHNISRPLGTLRLHITRGEGSFVLVVPQSSEPFDTSASGFSDEEILAGSPIRMFKQKGILDYTLEEAASLPDEDAKAGQVERLTYSRRKIGPL